MPPWFRKGLSPHHTALAMIGAKPGDHVVVIGAGQPDLAAEVALVTGLNGSTIVCDDAAGARERIEVAARKAGALIDFDTAPTRLSVGDASRDVAVILGAEPSTSPEHDRRTAVLREAMRVLRPGGRVIVIERSTPGGLFAARRERSRSSPDEVLALLDRIGTTARRQLADVNGVAYYEARK